MKSIAESYFEKKSPKKITAQISKEKLWIRCGDAADYEDFGADLDAAAQHLQMMGAKAPLDRNVKFHTEHTEYCLKDASGEYDAHNYITAFWDAGDEQAEVSRKLSDDELARLNERLEKYNQEATE